MAAFIAEPVQGSGGLIVPPDDYFPRIREICDKYDVLFISDEIITGFGRTGRWFGLERYGVQPDILAFAKGITSGYIPLGGIGLSDRVYKVIADAPPAQRWMHAFTYSAHPVGCAVGLAAIAAYERENLVAAAAAKGKKLLEGSSELRSLDLVGDVRGLGMLVGLELVEDKPTKKAFDPARKMGDRLHKECCKRGLYSRIRGDIYLPGPAVRNRRRSDGSNRQHPRRVGESARVRIGKDPEEYFHPQSACCSRLAGFGCFVPDRLSARRRWNVCGKPLEIVSN